jgi:hypothetical protein
MTAIPTRKRTARGIVAKAIIAIAVLVPAALILAVALHTRMTLTGLHIGTLTPWIAADAILLAVGLMLHNGEEL